MSVNKYFLKLLSGMSKSPFYGVKPWERKYKSDKIKNFNNEGQIIGNLIVFNSINK